MASPWLVFRTVRHLKPAQWFWRLKRKIQSPAGSLAPAPPDAFAVDPVLPSLPPAFDFLGENSRVVEDLHEGLFTFLNQSKKLGFPQPDWWLGPRREDRLWAVTLHYHSWAFPLAQRAPELFMTLVGDWIKRCDLKQPGARALAWNPYAVATRIGWWCRCYASLGRDFWGAQPEFRKAFLASLWRQADYLSGDVEWDLRANHVLRDGVGLAWAGRFFAGVKDRRPGKWSLQAAKIFRSQIPEQVLPDGGHYERSPMYQLQVMEDFLQAAELTLDQDLRDALKRVWTAMAEYAVWTRHPDGQITLLNDAALNGAQTPHWMLGKGAETLGLQVTAGLRRGLRHFGDTGLVVWQGDPCTVFFDVGPLGPDEQPGHGHADNLTIELSWGGERLFVDPGVYAYDEDERRALDRSTGSHNTVLIDGRDSSEVWKIFRVGRRAKPRGVEVKALPNGFWARAGHDGFDPLSGKPRHCREIRVEKNTFTVRDQVTGSGTHFLSGGFLLAPGWEASAQADGWKIVGKNNSLFMGLKGPLGLKWAVEKAVYHPQFGVEVPVSRLVWDWKGPLPFSADFVLSS